jgi:ATP-binding cassette subfamily B protein
LNPAVRSLLRAYRMLGRHWLPMLVGIVCVPLAGWISVRLTGLVGGGVDLVHDGFAGGDAGAGRTLVRLCVLLLALAAAEAVLRWTARMTLVQSSRRVEEQLKNELFAQLQRLPIGWFDRARTGDLLSRFTQDVELVRMVVGPIVLYGLGSLTILPLGLHAMWKISPRVTLAAAGAFALLLVGMAFVLPRIQRRSKAVQEAIAAISAQAAEDFSGIRVLHNFARARLQIATMARLCDEYVGHSLGLVRFRALQNLLIHLTGDVVLLALLVLGGLEIAQGRMSPGQLVQTIMLLALMTFPLIVSGWMLSMLHQAVAGAQRIEAIFAEPPEPAGGATPELHGELRVERLTFAYPGAAEPALRDVSFTLPAGRKLGIVGPVGSGKSTLLALLLRLYDPPPKTVFVDGHDVLSLAPAALRRRFGLAPQDPFLFSDTVRGNVEFGGAAPAAEIDAAFAAAALETDLAELQHGAESVVGERGVTLSGGQKQRVSLARALASGRETLLLDDSLSAVDHSTEARILARLRQRESRAMIVTAHRLSAVRDADWILFLERGRVVEQGPPADLLARDGAFAAAWRLQQEAAALESGGEVA